MQQIQIGSGMTCPQCKQAMKGYSVSYHHYNCPQCGNEFFGLAIKSNQLGQIIGAICLIGFVSIIAAMLK